jgi:hypothetical protein
VSSLPSSVEQLNTAASQVTLLISVVCIVLRSVVLLLNLAIFTRPSLRSNSCSIHFFWATCVNIFIVFVILPFRILVGTFYIDPTVFNEPLCNIQVYIFSIARASSLWFISLACIDGYLSSSSKANLRAFSSVKFARRFIGICALLLFIVYIHYLIYFEIGLAPDPFGRLTPTCVARRGPYRTFVPLWNLIWYALLPSCVMVFFVSLTMANIRPTRWQIVPQNDQWQPKRNRINTQLLKILFIQVVNIMLTILPFIVYRLRASLTSNYIKSQYEVAQDNFFLQVATVISLISHSISFYLFTLASTIFRRELIQILSKCARIPINHPQNGSTTGVHTGNHQSNTTHRVRFLSANQSINIIRR